MDVSLLDSASDFQHPACSDTCCLYHSSLQQHYPLLLWSWPEPRLYTLRIYSCWRVSVLPHSPSFPVLLRKKNIWQLLLVPRHQTLRSVKGSSNLTTHCFYRQKTHLQAIESNPHSHPAATGWGLPIKTAFCQITALHTSLSVPFVTLPMQRLTAQPWCRMYHFALHCRLELLMFFQVTRTLLPPATQPYKIRLIKEVRSSE